MPPYRPALPSAVWLSSMSDMGDIWSQLSHDPRDPQYSVLRASDLDREVIRGSLADAFADGRLTREEYDDRTGALLDGRTLGDLLPLLGDLDATAAPLQAWEAPSAAAERAEIRRQAESYYKTRRNQDVYGLVMGANLICWAIYIWSILSDGHAGFPWPIFVAMGTLGRLGSTLASKHEIIDRRVAELTAERHPELAAGEPAAETPSATSERPDES
jgi:hypothetical protein